MFIFNSLLFYHYQIGDYLLTLPQQLEPFITQENLALEVAMKAGNLPFPDLEGLYDLLHVTSLFILHTLFTGSHYDHEVIPILRSILTDNPPSPGKVDHTTGVYVPYSFRTVVWVLLRPTRTSMRQNLRFFVLIRED